MFSDSKVAGLKLQLLIEYFVPIIAELAFLKSTYIAVTWIDHVEALNMWLLEQIDGALLNNNYSIEIPYLYA